VLVSEVSTSAHRGGFLGYVFIANYLGISVAYWLDFGLSFVDGGHSALRWRLLLAFQCIPALFLLAGIKMLPDSPRFLASAGKTKEAHEVLVHLRGGDDEEIEKEYAEILAIAKESKKSSPIEFIKILLGLDNQNTAHLGRRAWLSIWLQIMASWTGITAVTAYSPVLLSQAGYSHIKQSGLAGGLNTIGIVGTIISAQVVDKFGRRTCLIWGSGGLFAVNLIVSKIRAYGRTLEVTDSLTLKGRSAIREDTHKSARGLKHCTGGSRHAVPVQSHLCLDMGHGCISASNRNIPQRHACTRQWVWYYRLGDWSWNDNPDKPNTVLFYRGKLFGLSACCNGLTSHIEPRVLFLRWLEPFMDSCRFPILPGNQESIA
jgi:hypothetical protein